jgi:hypothetical protein
MTRWIALAVVGLCVPFAGCKSVSSPERLARKEARKAAMDDKAVQGMQQMPSGEAPPWGQ